MHRDLYLEEVYNFLKEDMTEEDYICDAMIRASRKQKMTTNELLKTHREYGLIGVYNLGMKHMYEYLEGK